MTENQPLDRAGQPTQLSNADRKYLDDLAKAEAGVELARADIDRIRERVQALPASLKKTATASPLDRARDAVKSLRGADFQAFRAWFERFCGPL